MLCHVSVHNGAFCLRHRVLVAFFDRVASSDFNHLFELLDLLYIGIMLKKHFKNVHCEFYKQFSCRKRISSHTKQGRPGFLGIRYTGAF